MGGAVSQAASSASLLTPASRRPIRSLPLLVLLLTASCGSESASPSPSVVSGIRGSVLLGPTCPGPSPRFAAPCLTPYAATLVLTDGDGRRVAMTTAGADGRFEFLVTPGQYVVAPQPGGDPFPVAQPEDVTVDRGQFVEIQINYDTGNSPP